MYVLFLSATQVPSSSIIFKRWQTSLQLISPERCKTPQNNLDGLIALQVRGKIYIFEFGVNCPSLIFVIVCCSAQYFKLNMKINNSKTQKFASSCCDGFCPNLQIFHLIASSSPVDAPLYFQVMYSLTGSARGLRNLIHIKYEQTHDP